MIWWGAFKKCATASMTLQGAWQSSNFRIAGTGRFARLQHLGSHNILQGAVPVLDRGPGHSRHPPD